jgi:hypothetical protein
LSGAFWHIRIFWGDWGLSRDSVESALFYEKETDEEIDEIVPGTFEIKESEDDEEAEATWMDLDTLTSSSLPVNLYRPVPPERLRAREAPALPSASGTCVKFPLR